MRLGNAELHNVVEILKPGNENELTPSRIPDSLRVTLNPNAQDRATATPGCELRFNMESERVSVTLRCPEKAALAEVWYGPFAAGGQVVTEAPTTIEIEKPSAQAELLDRVARENSLAFDPALVRVILPYAQTRIVPGAGGDRENVVAGEIGPPHPEQVPKRRWLAYGSSITHGASAQRPTGTYAMRTAERLGVDLVNLGFGGGAHLEPQMADYIASRDDWDFASFEMGINMLGGFSVEEFAERVDYFVSKVARARPGKFIFCIDVFTCAGDFAGEEKPGLFREVVRKKVESLASPKVVHVPGTEILESVSGLTQDLTHPAPAGMEEMAGNLAGMMGEKLGR